MHRAGYVLTGGKSSRMGGDKALLGMGGQTLVETVAGQVRAASGTVTLVGPVQSYSHFGFRVVEDPHRGNGPLSGIHAALSDTSAEWNLIVACDMPNLTADFLRHLLEEAEAVKWKPDVLLPAGPGGWPEPLCAVYRRHCLGAVDEALRAGRWKVTAALSSLRQVVFPVAEGRWFDNANTPEDWRRILQERGSPADQ